MIEADLVDAVIGLGKNLFYNSSMESCLLVCRMTKPKERKGKIIFIDAKEEIRIERSTAYLKDEHIKRIATSYKKFKTEEGFSSVVNKKDVLTQNNGNLSVQLYVRKINGNDEKGLENLITTTKQNQIQLNKSLDTLFKQLKTLGIE
jgi:type I restriction enzyme M protein